jgi:CRP-like cAMP-binding protein
MEMLNENLKVELIVHLNGKMLHDSPLFKYYSLSFLSDLSFILKRETFSINEVILEEDTTGDRLHYITKGNVLIIHKKSATFLKEVSIDTFIGEVSFFSGKARAASARSINFTEVLTLYLSEFLEIAEKHSKQLETY